MGFPNVAYTSVINYFNGGYWDAQGEYPYFYYAYNINTRPEQQVFYYDAYDQMAMFYPWSGSVRLCRFDPAFVNNQAGSVILAVPGGGLQITGWAVGEWNKSAGTQKLCSTGWQSKFADINPATMTWAGTFSYGTEIGYAGQLNSHAPDTDGYFAAGTWGLGQCIFFESMGYGLYCYGRPYLTANGGYHGNVMFTASLSTGDAIETIAIPVCYKNSPTAWEMPRFMGDEIHFTGMQFVPDDDSTPTAPKGYLLLHESRQTPKTMYVKCVDWNPTGAPSGTGIPTRTHCQQRWLSLLSPSDAGMPNGLPWVNNHPVLVHATTGKMYMYSSLDNYTAAAQHTLDDHAAICEFGTSPTPAILTPPAFTGRTETNRTIEAIVHVAGDLGEPIGGRSVAFSAKQISQRGELLDNNGVGGVVYVDHPPIDEAGTTKVYEDGTELTTNWSVTDYATGEITFTSPKQLPGSTYTADYRHAQNPQPGSRVNVLTPAALTDDAGSARCRVKIADDDDLVGEWDQITASVEE